jgi:hypothetical protein
LDAPPVLTTILIATVSVSFASSAFAQSGRGAITGMVFDRSGAIIPGVRLSLSNAGTDTKFETVTTGTGNYLPPAPGVDTLLVEDAGFTSYHQTNIRLRVAAAGRVDVTLTVGQLTQSIQVVAEAPMLKTESWEQSTTMARQAITALPINLWIGSVIIAITLSWVTRPQAAEARISCRRRRWVPSPQLGNNAPVQFALEHNF